ncbi:MAG TPA: VCBS repeat-containing protein, partial [Gammaproteobacteria bacterium]|nr:VCBS repeat-containing protein [Gammaproteobacteria bacterium]
MNGARWFLAQRYGLKSLLVLLLSVLLAACGGGSPGDDAGLSARLNPDGTPATSPSDGSAGGTGAAGTTATPSGSSSLSLDISSPAQVKLNNPVTINASVSNAEGNVSYSLSAAPAGMRIDAASGNISWMPGGLNFGRDTLFSYRVSATDDSGTTTKTASIRLTDDGHQPLVRSSARVPTKQNSIHIGDFNGDGDNEVLVTDNLSLIYTLKWDATLNGGQGDFYQEWVYPYSLGNQASIDAIDAADVNGDGRLDIIVLNGNTVSVIDGVSRTLTYSYEIADAQRGYAVFARNIDDDPAIEIVTLVSKGSAQEQIDTFTLPTDNSRSLSNDWTSEVENYGTSMVIANVDFADNWPEIVTSAGYVIDGVSLKDEWTKAKPPGGFGDQIIAADVDGDGLGVDEIVGLYPQTANGIIEVFSPQHQSSLFSEPYPLRKPESTRCSMAVSDLDGNGQDEIIVGACIDGAGIGTSTDGEYLKIFTTYDSAVFSSAPEWIRLKNNGVFYDERLHGGFVSLAVGDVDNDGNIEAIWANNFGGNKYAAFTVLPLPQNPAADIRRQTIKSQNLTLALMQTPFTGAVDFQFSATQRYATFMSSSDPAEKMNAGDTEYKHGARLMFVDYDSGRVNISSQVAATNTTITGTMLQAEDVMGLGYDQLVLTSGEHDTDNRELTQFQLLDFGTRKTPDNTVHHGWLPVRNDYFENLVGGGLANGFDLADIDSDGRLELVGYIGSYLYSVDFEYDNNHVFEYLK